MIMKDPRFEKQKSKVREAPRSCASSPASPCVPPKSRSDSEAMSQTQRTTLRLRPRSSWRRPNFKPSCGWDHSRSFHQNP